MQPALSQPPKLNVAAKPFVLSSAATAFVPTGGAPGGEMPYAAEHGQEDGFDYQQSAPSSFPGQLRPQAYYGGQGAFAGAPGAPSEYWAPQPSRGMPGAFASQSAPHQQHQQYPPRNRESFFSDGPTASAPSQELPPGYNPYRAQELAQAIRTGGLMPSYSRPYQPQQQLGGKPFQKDPATDTRFYLSALAAHLSRGPPPLLSADMREAEERAIFYSSSGAPLTKPVSIDFDKHGNGLDVERNGRDASEQSYPPLESFIDLAQLALPELQSVMERNVRLMGYTNPTPVQRHAIPFAAGGRDLMTCAQTGSGKTAAYLAPFFLQTVALPPLSTTTVATNLRARPRGLVLAPTRELCAQIYGEARKFANRTELRIVQVYGGAPTRPQLVELAHGVDMIVATPGRLIDYLERNIVGLDLCTYLVLDEADRMLDMGFSPQIRRIIQEFDLPDSVATADPSVQRRQTLMFSATFSRDVQRLASDFLYDYAWISIGKVGAAAKNVEQRIIQTSTRDKYATLVHLLRATKDAGSRILIFVEKRVTANTLTQSLRHRERIETLAIHGNMQQWDREASLRAFAEGAVNVLVATDVAARGLDVDDISHVINFDMPKVIDDYIHRIGRTGRAGKKGVSTSLFVVHEGTSGDDGIAKELLATLRRAGQVIPDWLAREYDTGHKGPSAAARHARVKSVMAQAPKKDAPGLAKAAYAARQRLDAQQQAAAVANAGR